MKRIIVAIKFLQENHNMRWHFIGKWCSNHLPHLLRCTFHILRTGSLNYKNPYFNVRGYEQLTKNDFKRGNLICLLSKIGAIRKYSYEEDPDSRWFWDWEADE